MKNMKNKKNFLTSFDGHSVSEKRYPAQCPAKHVKGQQCRRL